ncbi:glycoside hydrolase [Phlegmacium glaucopus]|nr:glycoside hydrolase [Phlegmacium glaucopus]
MAERPFSTASGDTMALAMNIPLPLTSDDSSFFLEPRAPYMAPVPFTSNSPRESYLNATPNDSGTMLATKNENYAIDPILTTTTTPPKSKRRSLVLALLFLLAVILVAAAVIVPVYFTVIKPKLNRSAGANSLGDGSSGSPTTSGGQSGPKPTSSPTNQITGGDGSTIHAADGSTFTYNNKFGGFWVADPNDPFNNNAQPNSWTPPLNQSWNYGINRINGVNLGGWFVLEPFITPALFQKYPGAVDEWTLSTLMAADTANGGLNQLEDHYKTFITEQDIAEIAGAGLNWIRLPIPFWAIDVWADEPFLAKTSWKYIVQALQWCRKYGIRVKFDLHTIPGSQNGYNHSGKSGQINFLHGIMGMANAQRTLNYIRIITEFISQAEWKDVVPMFGIVNEALITTIGTDELRGFYVEAYNTIRGITGIGEGNGPYISIHEGFRGLEEWADFLTGADRLTLDIHPYFAFNGEPNLSPIDTGTGPGAGGMWPQAACNDWASSMNASRIAFGTTIAGEFSNGINDCGLYLKGITGGSTYGGNCADWEDASQWTDGTKAGLLAFALSSMDALRDYFFWTWKVDKATSGIVESPLWSYQLGLQGGWMPTDPRSAVGVCGAAAGPIFSQSFQSWMTGGAGAGVIAPAKTVPYPYPPVTLEDTPPPVTQLPSYTSTGAISTLPVPTYTDSKGRSINAGNGWFDAQDTMAAPTPIAGCTYPDAWDAVSVPLPAGVCGGARAGVPGALGLTAIAVSTTTAASITSPTS